MTTDNKYYDWIDTAKGIGILLVIMEHTMFPIHAAVSIFHMPLFFFISGITLKKPSHLGQFFIRKVNRIFVPYMFLLLYAFLFVQNYLANPILIIMGLYGSCKLYLSHSCCVPLLLNV